jgi:predicted acylesterase/phospholipase RssA
MQRIGLAFSGGGFRATLFHLGMVRLLREANILPGVTHVTSVSGGSILAAHLVLNWHRYTGTLKEFDAAAAELIRFIQMDLRNCVMRRYPLALPLRALRRLALLGPVRQLTRTGLLEYHYEKYLYGKTCLFQLPERPRLFILATNLSEGCLCAFTRDGLLIQRRQPGKLFRFDLIHTGLATLPMAVTASSAFPPIFPPLELNGHDVGADPGRFGRLAFTDGGIYDNLGVRMFRCLEQSWMARGVGLHADDFTDCDEVCRVLQAASRSGENASLSHLVQSMAHASHEPNQIPMANEAKDQMLASLWEVMKKENLAREPAFADLAPPDPAALPALQAAKSRDGEVDEGALLWVNRQLVEAALRKATGKPCFRSLNVCFDAVLVSDAGKRFKISPNTRATGLIATAMRATDIVMDRVWQLEVNTFAGTPGFVFAPINTVVEQTEDPTALHPEVQRMVEDIRTDMDRFSPLEISSLIRHGYCVGRSICRSRPDLFGTTIPTEKPWDPLASDSAKTAEPQKTDALLSGLAGSAEAEDSRRLQQSADRRIWSRLLDYRDWTSYIYVPLLVPILVVLPYFIMKWYRQAHIDQQLVESMAQSNRDYAFMRKLLQEDPSPPFEGMRPEEVRELTPVDYKGFEVIADMRVFDFRPWKPSSGHASDEHSWAHGYRRVRVQKLEATANRFVMLGRTKTAQIDVRSLTDRMPMKVRLLRNTAQKVETPLNIFEIEFDLSKIPVRTVVDLAIEYSDREPRPANWQALDFYVDTDTALLSLWLLMPYDLPVKSFDVFRFSSGKEPVPEIIAPSQQITLMNGRIAAFSVASAKPGFVYEFRPSYQD